MTLGVFSPDDRTDDAVLMASVQGAFFGIHLPAARIEGLIAAHVPKKHLKELADVYGSKWWDYRRLSPGHSFLLFTHCYYRSLKSASRKFGWMKARQDKRGITGVNMVHYKAEEIWDRDRAHITGMWNAMIMCDAMGVPYDQYCSIANQMATDAMWQRVPSPAQLYSQSLGSRVLEQWEILSKDRLFTAKHPMYALDNYAGLEAQDAYQGWLVANLKERREPVTAICNVVYRTPQLPEAVAAQHFSAHAMTRARLMAV